MSDKTEVKNLLLTAADIIEEEGWVRGAYEAPQGFCLIGALNAIPDNVAYYDAVAALSRVVGLGVASWNDYTCKSKQEAIDALLYAAETL